MLMQMSSTQMLAILTNLTILARVTYQLNNALSSPAWPRSSVVRASVKEENPGIVGLKPTKVKKTLFTSCGEHFFTWAKLKENYRVYFSQLYN